MDGQNTHVTSIVYSQSDYAIELGDETISNVGNDTKKIVLMHLSDHNNTPSDHSYGYARGGRGRFV